MQTKRRRRLTSSSKVSHSVVVIVIVMSHSGIDFFKQGQGELCRRNHLGRHKILPGSPISTASFITIVCTACTAQPMCVWIPTRPPTWPPTLTHPLALTGPLEAQSDARTLESTLGNGEGRPRRSISPMEQLGAGAIAGAVAKSVIAPADRVKILYQVNPKRAFSLTSAWKTGGTFYVGETLPAENLTLKGGRR